MNSRKRNLILNSISLFVTSFLLVMVLFAWYATNKVASVTGGSGGTKAIGSSLALERGVYYAAVPADGDTPAVTEHFEWVATENLSFTNVSPGNKFFFRMKITVQNDEHNYADISFGNVSSKLIENKLVVENSKVCKVDGSYKLPLYEIKDNAVKVTRNKVEKTLYTISGSTISLADCKIENVFMFYNLGLTEPINKNLTGKIGTILTSLTDYGVALADGNDKWLYFALEFNEAESLTTYNDIESSNAYLYQQLLIDHIAVTTVKKTL